MSNGTDAMSWSSLRGTLASLPRVTHLKLSLSFDGIAEDDQNVTVLVLASLLLAVVSFIIAVVALCYFRKFRRETEQSIRQLSLAVGVQLSERIEDEDFRSFEESGDVTATLRRLSETYGVSFEVQPEQRLSFVAPADLPRRHSASIVGQDPPPCDFNGCWKCTETWGMDDFLGKLGISKIRRMAACRAPWPSWEFHQAGNDFTYVNRTAMGDMKETFVADGPDYEHRDLQNNLSTCRAFWQGRSLVMERRGPQGLFIETRTLTDNDELAFVIFADSAHCSAGRKFERVVG